MNISRYITLPYLYKLLSAKSIPVGVVGISLLFIFSMNLVGLVVFMISALAISFSMYMLFVLYSYNKTGWIFGFLVWMGISFLPFFLMSNENLFMIAAKFSPLLFFILYTMFLKMKVGEWLIETEFKIK